MSDYPCCDAKNCGLSETSVPGLRLFEFPKSSQTPEDRGVLLIWQRVAQLPDGTTGRWLCERHFKRMEFNSKGTDLVKLAVPTYPTGDFNSLTQNYCPKGREHLDKMFPPGITGKTTNKTQLDLIQVKHPSPRIKHKCLIMWCNNDEDTKTASLFGLPLKDPDLLKKWVEVIPMKHWQPSEKHRLCSAHFTPDLLSSCHDGRLVLQKESVPSVFTTPPFAKALEKKLVDLKVIKNSEPLATSVSSTDKIPLLSVNGESFNRKGEITSKLTETTNLIKELSKTIAKLKEAVVEKDANSVVRFLNKKNKADSSLFVDLFVAKNCPVHNLDVAVFMKNRKRLRMETKSKVVELGSSLEVTIPKSLPILERIPADSPKNLPRDWTGMPLDYLVDELNMRESQVDVLYSGMFEMMENWFSEKGIQNAYNEYCWEGIKAALNQERSAQKRDHIIDSSLILMFLCPEIYYALGKILPPLSEVLRGKSKFGSTPGFTNSSFEELAKDPSRSPVCLSFLEQAIETEVLWDGSKLRGYCDFGFDAPFSDKIPKAFRVLVFFVTCLKTDFRIPLGYHFVEHATAPVIANITKCYLIKLFQKNVRCCAFVCEPESKCFEVLKCFGFDYDFLRSSTVESTWFLHPEDKTQKIYCFFDSFRLAQQAGYLLVERGELIVNSSGQKASWSFIRDLEAVIDETVNNASEITTNVKLNDEWAKIMEKLDVQQSFFLNKARSEALAFCSQNAIRRVPTCLSTTDFVDKINEFYDCCSSTKTQDCRPLSKATKDQVKTKIKELTVYFWNMWVSNGFAKQSGRKMPILGFLLNLSNLTRLIQDYDNFFDEETAEIFTSRVNMTRFDEFLAKIKAAEHYSSSFGFQNSYESGVKSLLEPQEVVLLS